jgi:hypothetical protein
LSSGDALKNKFETKKYDAMLERLGVGGVTGGA